MTTHQVDAFTATLPGRYYYDEELYQQEQAKIFAQMWVCVGRAESVAAPGAYFLVDLAGENVIVVRGRDGVVRAFLNVCRHRGARVCTAERGQVGGSMQCRYHAWTYGLDGRLIGAPNIMSSEQFDRTAHGLIPVNIAIWEELIWLNMAEESTHESVDQQLDAALLTRFGQRAVWDRYGLAGLTVGASISYDVHANWKLVVENFMECYHCAPMHPELCRLIPSFRSGQSYQQNTGVGSAFADHIQGFSFSGEATRPLLPGLHQQDDRMYFGLVLPPNVLVSLLPDHVILHTALPLGPDRTRVICDWLFDPPVVAAPGFDPTNAVEVFDLVNRQDWEACEMVQQNMHSRAYAAGGIYVPAEAHIDAFNQMVRTRMGIPANGV